MSLTASAPHVSSSNIVASEFVLDTVGRVDVEDEPT